MKALYLLPALAAALVPVPARAATYLLNYHSTIGSPMTATLRISTADAVNSVGGHDIVAIGGFVGSEAIAGLVANPNQGMATRSADGLFIYDNNFFDNAPVLSNPGVLFNGADGFEYNLFSRNLSQFELYKAQPHVGYVQNSVGSLSAVAVPEPGQWALLLGGFLVMGVKLRRRRGNARAVFA